MTVAQRYSPLTITTVAGTSASTPLVTPLDLGDCRLDRVDLRIPPGPSGLVGVAITQAGTQLWPWGPAGSWIVGDDESYQVPIGTEIDQGISVLTYNLDTFNHALYLKFLYTPIALVVNQATLVPIVPVS